MQLNVHKSLRWFDGVFQGQYLPSLRIHYVTINKDWEKLPLQLYWIKMKICNDQGYKIKWHWSCYSNKMTPLPILLAAVFLGTDKYYFNNECKGFIRFPNTRKHLKHFVFDRLETWGNPKHKFLKWLLQRNNTKLCSVVFLICCIQSAFIIFLSFCF